MQQLGFSQDLVTLSLQAKERKEKGGIARERGFPIEAVHPS